METNKPDPPSHPGYFLKTKRLGFRHWTQDDLGLAVDLWGDEQVMRFIDKRGSLSETQVQARLTQEMLTQSEHGVQYWPLFLLQSHTHVGCAGLKPYDETKRIFELGFHICTKHWRRGYASEAAEAVIAHAFNTLSVVGLFAGHNPENQGSRDLLVRLGFRYTHDEFYEPTGMLEAAYLLLAGDFANRSKA